MQSFTKQIFYTLSKVTFLFLVFFSFQVQAQVTISGTIIDVSGDPLEGIEIEATDLGSTFTDETGYYEFEAPLSYNGTISPISPNDYANGITLIDALLMRAHIIGVQLLDSPFKRIAANISAGGGSPNGNGITTFDQVLLLQIIEGISSDFGGLSPSWIFIDGDYNPIEPWNDPIPVTNIVSNLTEDLTINFRGIKMGDMDCDAANGFNTIVGSIYFDENQNCTDDDNALIPDGWKVQLQGTNNYFQVFNEAGNFIIAAPSGDYTLEIIPPNPYWETCEATYPVTIGDDPAQLNIAAKPVIDCPFMEVNLSTPFLRRCFDSNYNIEYCNTGTELAEDATVTVIFDDFFDVVSTSVVPSNIDGNIYTFDLGDVEVGECGSISAVVYVSCDAELGQTHCTEAFVTPDDWCFPTNALYSGADLEVTGTCENDEVKFRIENVGEDMTEPVDYIIIEDLLVKHTAELQLNGGEFIEMQEASNGTTCRLEVEQIAHHPLGHQLIAFVEGCGTHPDGSVSLGFVTQFPFDGDKPFTDVDCRENIGAYDPNDITGFARGYDAEHFIDKGQKLEYLIRFQNTGTDTAFNVRVENPLPLELDWATFKPLVSSHDYEYVFEEDQVVFYFQDIMLPDSNINEAASHGYIRYEIEQEADLEIGTVINNVAGIYFDFNEPVITNTYFHTIGEPIFSVESSEVFLPNVAINYFPNPTSDKLTVELETEDFRNGKLEIFDAQGRSVKIENFEANSLIINVQDLTDGLYFFYVSMNGNAAASGKLVKK